MPRPRPSKLTFTQCGEIRTKVAAGAGQREMARLYGVSSSTVNGIVQGQQRVVEHFLPSTEEVRRRRAFWYKNWLTVNRVRLNVYSTASQRRYRDADPLKFAMKDADHSARRRTLKSSGHVSAADWLGILEYFGHACAYCLSTDVKLTQDHLQ